MKSLSNSQKMSVLVVPLLLAGVFGTSVASAGYMGGGGQGQSLNEEQRVAMEEVRELRMSGDFEGAMQKMRDNGAGHKMGGPRGDMREAIHDAVVSGDYEDFMDAIEGSPLEDIADEDTFELLMDAYSLRQEGEYQEARELMQDFRSEVGMNSSFRTHHNK